MDRAWSAVLHQNLKLPTLVTVPIVIIAAAVVVAIVLFGGTLGIVLILLAYSYFAGKVVAQKARVWKSFAEANGWYILPAAGMDARFVPPCLFGLGRKRLISDVVHATFEGHECDVFLYQFTTGSGKSRQIHYYTIARVTLAKPFPHLLLDSRDTWLLHQQGDAVDSVKLEGDFSKHFNLYFRKDDHVNALSVITPDIMQTLMEFNRAQDIELIDTSLYFMASMDKRTTEAMPAIFKSVDVLADEIAHKAKTIKYTPHITENVQKLAIIAEQSGRSGNMVMNSLIVTVMFVVLIPVILAIVMWAISASQ